MEPNEMARLYADVAKNLSRDWLEASSAMFDGAWGNGTRAAEEVLARAARRSGEETRAVFVPDGGTPDTAFLARAGDLVRAQAFLWVSAGLAAGERLGRAASADKTLAGLADLAAFGWAPR
ncbi:MAG: hypothetical protein M3246_05840, partial [Actinomycetota bacterium]|nr:hypothetical protein [Actinomycetota bacterium]